MGEPDQVAGAGVPDLDRPFDLRETFLRRQGQLLATLGVGRSSGGHPVAIGDDAELNWRGMLESILPTRYRVGKGFAVDADGKRSEQVDVMIYDRHFSPLLLEVGEYAYVPAEAVYGALEVKQELSRETIEYASKKVASVRSLRRTSAPIPHAGGKFDSKPLHHILGGLLTSQSSWNPPLGQPLEDALRDVRNGGALDLGCALRDGSFEVAEDGSLARSDEATALIFFILRLLDRLRASASAPAIEWDAYTGVLEDRTGG